MKEKIRLLKIFNFSHPLMNTEVLSLLGDKYRETLPFQLELSSDYNSSDVILWDGVMTPRNHKIVEKILRDVKTGKVLLLIGESLTLFKDHALVRSLSTENLNCVELPGWNLLPEEILMALETCYKKSKHV